MQSYVSDHSNQIIIILIVIHLLILSSWHNFLLNSTQSWISIIDLSFLSVLSNCLFCVSMMILHEMLNNLWGVPFGFIQFYVRKFELKMKKLMHELTKHIVLFWSALYFINYLHSWILIFEIGMTNIWCILLQMQWIYRNYSIKYIIVKIVITHVVNMNSINEKKRDDGEINRTTLS